MLEIVRKVERGFGVSPCGLIPPTSEFIHDICFEHSLRVGVARLDPINRWMKVRHVNGLRERDENREFAASLRAGGRFSPGNGVSLRFGALRSARCAVAGRSRPC